MVLPRQLVRQKRVMLQKRDSAPPRSSRVDESRFVANAGRQAGGAGTAGTHNDGVIHETLLTANDRDSILLFEKV